MLVRSSNGTYEAIDFRETAPQAAFEGMFNDDADASVRGGLASGIPGELRGLEYLHKNYGKLPWSTVLQPAIEVARLGFPVSEDLVRYMAYATQEYDFLTYEPVWAVDFAPNGTRLGVGDRMTRERYANTLEQIATKGPTIFYTGTMANATVRAIQAANGTMTMEDLRQYQVVTRQPVEISYRGYRVLGCGTPASGSVVLSALKTVEGYGGFSSPRALNLSTHRLDEAIRFAYGERASLGDPDFVEGMDDFEADMLNATTARITRGKISDEHTLNISAYDPSGFESLESHGTSHVVTADASGMAITLTTTINLLFGSQVMVPETGVIMNDEMNDFSIPGKRNQFGYVPSPSNYIRPGKRPLSSITPTIVESASNGSTPQLPYFITGAAGGSRIITATLLSIWHVLDHNLSAPDALSQKRFHDQLIPNILSVEDGYDPEVVSFMADRGHNVSSFGLTGGVGSSMQAIRIASNGTFEAAGEPRQESSGGFAI